MQVIAVVVTGENYMNVALCSSILNEISSSGFDHAWRIFQCAYIDMS